MPDERDLADLILFGQRFAAHVRYWAPDNRADGDWQTFFSSDVTAALAALARLPVEACRTCQGDLERWLRGDPSRAPVDLAAHFRLWFHLPLALLEVAGRHHARLPDDHALAPSLPRLVARDLAEPLTKLAGWYKGALDDGGGPGANIFADEALQASAFNLAGGNDPRVRLSSTVAALLFDRPKFSQLTIAPSLLSLVPPGSWPAMYAAAPADPAPYADAATVHARIYDALTYNLLTRAVERVMQGVVRIRQDAEAALSASLREFARHPAHYGLWLAFLELFRHAQREMNAFTGRHLDFYFRDVLRLQPRRPVADHAHVTFVLAKGIERHLLQKGTALRAGKDGLGRPVTFALDNDLVVNRGRVVELSGLRQQSGTWQGRTTLLPRVAPVAASADGLGEVDLPPESPSFPPFGPIAAPAARIGFAVADRQLFLREGIRTISLRAEIESPLALGFIPVFRVALTGPKGWFEPAAAPQFTSDETPGREEFPSDAEEGVPDRSAHQRAKPTTAKELARQAAARRRFSFSLAADEPTKGSEDLLPHAGKARPRRGAANRRRRFVEWKVTLSAMEPAVIPLDPKLHGDEHAPGLPVAELVFDFTAESSRAAWAVMHDLRPNRVTIRVEASQLKNLKVIAAGAEFDPAKPFAPFGPRPRAGDTLIVGSSEIFSKRIDSWSLQVDWLTPYTSSGFYRSRSAAEYLPTESLLAGGTWNEVRTLQPGRAVPGTSIGLDQNKAVVQLESASLIDGRAEQTLDNPPLAPSTATGFLKLTLNRGFGHSQYPIEQARAMVSLARGVEHNALTGVNYLPGSSPKIGILPRMPYDPVITRIEARYTTVRTAVERIRLLAPFGTEPVAGKRLFPAVPFAGALHIGIADFVPPAKLTLLIQVEDGSGDPLLPVPKLEFAFLAGDRWVAFDEQDVDDKTLSLTTSGVLGLAVPVAANTSHLSMTDGLTWVRIAARAYPEALNRLRSITAQAGRATFVDAGNDPDRLTTELPAGAISRLAEPVPAIKTVAQPYPGFGGRPTETAPAMDTRVAERLRHKNRAIAMWDVEALVLEAFPALDRVKCLSLTELKRNASGVVIADNEQKPGSVAVVVVPTITAASARNPLRPYADRATLTAVERFLRKHLSPFVNLEVTNPRFEEVHLAFEVRFVPEIQDVAFYVERLNAALVAYLSPWTTGAGEITFGGRLWRSSVIDFLDERPEVEFVTEVRMYHKIDVAAPDSGWTPIALEVIEATSARSILVSAPRHQIRQVQANG